jgi:hypothetical protein
MKKSTKLIFFLIYPEVDNIFRMYPTFYETYEKFFNHYNMYSYYNFIKGNSRLILLNLNINIRSDSLNYFRFSEIKVVNTPKIFLPLP